MSGNPKGEIKIGGAGISGLTVAIILSKAGYKVRVFERNSDVGKRFREDLEGLMNWGFDENVLKFMQRIGLKTDFWNKPLKNLSLFNSHGIKTDIESEEPFVYLVKRGSGEGTLDHSLKMQAMESGAEIIFDRTAVLDEMDIIATGPKFDGMTDAMASGYSFKTNSPDMFIAALSNKLSCKGYSYLLIADGRGTIASCIFGNYGKISGYLEKTVSFFKTYVEFDMREEKRFSGFGNFFNLRSEKKYVGEAGGFQDFLWGFGMRYAMITANLASRSIIEGANYKKLWRAELSGHKKSSLSNRLWFSLLNDYCLDRFIDFLGGRNDALKFIDKIYKPNNFSKIIYPFARIYFHENVKDSLSPR